MLDAVFEPTLNMINQDFTEYPEHRVGLYRLLRAIDTQCFPGTLVLQYFDLYLRSFAALLSLPPVQFKLIFDCIIWGMKHTLRDIADAGLISEFIEFMLFLRSKQLPVLYEMVDNFAKSDPTVANAFFQQFFTALLQDLYFVLTDTDHKSGMSSLYRRDPTH